jgi:putative ABC transport system permease protein
VQERIRSISDTFDFAVVIEPQQAQDINQFTDLLSGVDGVRDIYPSYSAAVRVEGYEAGESVMARSKQVSAQGVDPDHSAFRFDLQEGGGWTGNPNEVIITFTVADKLGKHAGDTLVVTTRGQPHEFTIVGVDVYPFDALFFNWQELAVLTGYVDGEGNPLPDAFLVQLTSSNASINEVNDRIADLEALLLDHGIAATYINQTEVTQSEASETNMLVVIFNIAAGVMALVGIVGLLATLSMSVFERQREIGIMRSVGAGSVTIAAQFLTEGILVGVLAWVASIPVSYVLSLRLVDMMPFARSMQFVYPLIVLAIGLGGMLVVTALASLWPSISASRRTVSAILRYQ